MTRLPFLFVAVLGLPALAQVTHFRHVDPAVPGVGWSVRGIGDVDLDGRADVAVGAIRIDCGFPGCGPAVSRVSVLSGVDGAGRPDLIVGAPYVGGIFAPQGEARLHSGLDGSVLGSVSSASSPLFGLAVA